MKKSNTIFVAHNFTPASKNALNIATKFALKTNSELFIFNIISSAILTENAAFIDTTPTKEINKHKGLLKRTANVLSNKNPTLKVSYAVEYGFLLPTMIAKTEEIKPWLFILGVNKRTNFEKIIFGDTCTTLIDKVLIPTLIIPLNYKTINTNLVTYAWDGKTTETAQLNSLEKITSDGNKLLVLNITHHDEAAIKNANVLKRALTNKFSTLDVSLLQIMGLDEKNEFKKSITNIQPNLLVVYAHHYSFWQSIFHQSFTKQAIGFSKSPVLVVY